MQSVRTFAQHFTRFQLTVCSHGSSALAELLAIIPSMPKVNFGPGVSPQGQNGEKIGNSPLVDRLRDLTEILHDGRSRWVAGHFPFVVLWPKG